VSRLMWILTAIAAIVILLMAGSFYWEAPEFRRTYDSIQVGTTEASLRSTYRAIGSSVELDNDYVAGCKNPRAKRMLEFGGRRGWDYWFYLDASGRVVAKEKGID